MSKKIVVPIDIGSIRPEYKTSGAAGCDLVTIETKVIEPGQAVKVPTGLKIAIPEGYFGFIKERSSLAAKGLSVAGGIIDSDYRGPIFVNMLNLTDHTIIVHATDRIANLIFIPCMQADFPFVPRLEETARGEGGYGSTGK